MRLAASTGLIIALVLVAGPARAQEGRDHTHHPGSGTTDARALLRMVAALQESFKSDQGRYASNPQELRIPSMRAIQLHLTASGASGYTAVAVSAAEECVLYHGAVRSPREYAVEPNRVTCRVAADGTNSRS